MIDVYRVYGPWRGGSRVSVPLIGERHSLMAAQRLIGQHTSEPVKQVGRYTWWCAGGEYSIIHKPQHR